MAPSEFWDATPREAMLVIEAHREQQQARERDARASAWLTAMLGRCDPKKFPRFDKFVGAADRQKPQAQTLQQQRAIIHMLAHAKGGFGTFEKLEGPPDYSKWDRLRAQGLAWEMKKKGNA
jgi:hypothetical protein